MEIIVFEGHNYLRLWHAILMFLGGGCLMFCAGWCACALMACGPRADMAQEIDGAALIRAKARADRRRAEGNV